MNAPTICLLLIVQVHAYTTRSYDLEVPGSEPIRIIEAEPGWNLNQHQRPALQSNPNDRNDRVEHNPYTHRGDRDDRYSRPDFEHRTLRPDIISNRNDRISEEDYEDNSEKLKKFLNSYAQNLKKPLVEVDNNGQAKDELVLKDKFTDEIIEPLEKPEKSKSWNLLHFDKIPNGPQEHKKWVSMDAVPWSVSKISKWHGKPKKDKYQNQVQTHNQQGFYDQYRPYNDRFQQVAEYPRPSYPKPLRPSALGGQRPTNTGSGGYYDDIPAEVDFEDPVEDDYYNNKRPSFSRPTATFGHKVNVHAVQNNYGGNKRPAHQHDNCNPNHHQSQGQGPSGDGQDGIITDGLPPNFPDHEYGNRRRGVASDPIPATHPFNGDGEWVLLTTTKGYKYPKNRQRSIQFSDAQNDNAIQTHKSVRLTVLPPLDDGRVNMTTSHGGLLQVDGTFQSVDEAQKAYAKRQRIKTRQPQRRPVKVRPQLGQLHSNRNTNRNTNRNANLLAQQQQIQYQLSNQASKDSETSSSDSNAVLAAVGASMIPAGMALLVPMAMSGKRRRRQIEFYPDFITTSPYTHTDTVELTLPTSL